MYYDIYYEPTEQDLQDWAALLEAQDREEKEARVKALRSHPAYIYGGREAWTVEEQIGRSHRQRLASMKAERLDP